MKRIASHTLMRADPRRLTVRLLRDGSKATMLITGLSMTVILGYAGLGIDVASSKRALRNLQGASDPTRTGATKIAERQITR